MDPDGDGSAVFASLGSSVMGGRSWKTANDRELGVGGGGATEARHSTTCRVVIKPLRLGNASEVKDGRARGNQQSFSRLECLSMNCERVTSSEADAPVRSGSLRSLRAGNDKWCRYENSSGISRC